MKAAVVTRYGGPEAVRVEEVPKPSPKPDEIVVRVHASAVNSADWRIRRANPWLIRFAFGMTGPRRPILGVVFAGEVSGIGPEVRAFRRGDRLFGWTGGTRMGGHAEFVALPEDGPFVAMPSRMRFAEAAAIPFGFGTALGFLRKAKVDKGQRVLIHGASGSVGSAAVQLARCMGAEVTAVCGTRNLELVRSLGASRVLDYNEGRFLAHRARYDVVFDTVGKLRFSDCMNLVKPQGTLILGSEMPADMRVRAVRGVVGKRGSQVKVIGGTARESAEDMKQLAELWRQGTIKPVIESVPPIEAIARAHERAESGRKVGNLVIEIPEGSASSRS